jgi:pimeloyl-ACP methyl ester carboxylesterase
MKKSPTRSIVFITGAFIGSNCWDEWRRLFERRGYSCTVPAWPNKAAQAELLRNEHPDSAIASNRLQAIVDYFARLSSEGREQPILIGHSLGGLIVQLLLQRGIGAAGVALHSFPPPRTVVSQLFLSRPIWSAMGFFSAAQKTYMIPFLTWKRVLANGLSCEEQKESFYSYAIPESKLIIRDLFTPAARPDFKKYHPPLLLISGSCDRLVPAAWILDNYWRYSDGNSITDYKNFKGQNHLPFENRAFQEESDFVYYWLRGIL